MTTELFLGVRLQPNQFQRIKIENFNLNSTVEALKIVAAQRANVQKQSIGKKKFEVIFVVDFWFQSLSIVDLYWMMILLW